jgi:hypothetical protein
MRRVWLTLVAIAALAAQAHAAAKSVTLLGITGAGGEHFADQLEEDLSDLYQVVPGEVYSRTVERLEKSGASAEEVQSVGSRLRIDAVIAGAISGEGRARQLLITVRVASGRVIARGRYELGGRTLPSIHDRVLADLVRVLEHINTAPLQAQKPRKPEPAHPPRREETDDDDDSTPAPPPSRSAPPPAPSPSDEEG